MYQLPHLGCDCMSVLETNSTSGSWRVEDTGNSDKVDWFMRKLDTAYHVKNPGYARLGYAHYLGLEDQSLLKSILNDSFTLGFNERQSIRDCQNLLKGIRSDYGTECKESCDNKSGTLNFINAFVEPYRKWIAHETEELSNSIGRKLQLQAKSNLFFEVAHALIGAIPNSIYEMATQTIILEINILNEERYHENKPVIMGAQLDQIVTNTKFQERVFENYPLFAHRFADLLLKEMSYRLELLRNVQNDAKALIDSGMIDEDDSITSIIFDNSDRHKSGKSVAKLEIKNGHSLYYKPKPLYVDQKLYEIQAKILESLDLTSVTPDTLSMQDHGWQTEVSTNPITEAAELSRFYKRVGVLLAMAYAFQISDLHYENLIANGEHPVLIDLETAFHSYPNYLEEKLGTQPNRSVLDCGLLTLAQEIVDVHGKGATIDLGGLGSASERTINKLVPVVQFNNNGIPYISSEHREIHLHGANVPTSAEDEDQPGWEQFESEILMGFEHGYNFISETASSREGGRDILEEFEGLQVRLVLRPTNLYAQFLKTSLHPDYMVHPSDQDWFFSFFWTNKIYAPDGVWRSEVDQLKQGDIPYFKLSLGSTGIFDAYDRLVGPVSIDPLERVQARIRSMNRSDCDRQMWAISAAHVARRSNLKGAMPKASQSPDSTCYTARGEVDLTYESSMGHESSLCAQFGKELLERLLDMNDGNDRPSWNTLQVDSAELWHVIPASLDMYSGISGIGLALIQAGYSFDHSRARTCGRDVCELVATRLTQYLMDIESEIADTLTDCPWASVLDSVGLTDEIGGGLMLLTLFDSIDGESRYKSVVLDWCMVLEGYLSSGDRCPDVVGGSAGLIRVAKGIGDVYGYSDFVIRLIRRQCDDIVKSAVPQANDTVGWVLEEMGSEPLCGYAHGASGIASSLAIGASILNTTEFDTTIVRALEYEAIFHRQLGTWPDLRKGIRSELPGINEYHAWCHGAPGIALARAEMLDTLPRTASTLRSRVLKELLLALEKTAQSVEACSDRDAMSDCLCHGLAGIHSIFVYALSVLDRYSVHVPTVQKVAALQQQLERDILHRAKVGALKYGNPEYFESPGLFCGLSGLLLHMAQFSKESRFAPSDLLRGAISC